MNSLVIYEAGARSPSGKYSKFIESPKQQDVDDYLCIMKGCVPCNFELVKLEKTYHLVSTTPHIISRANNEVLKC